MPDRPDSLRISHERKVARSRSPVIVARAQNFRQRSRARFERVDFGVKSPHAKFLRKHSVPENREPPQLQYRYGRAGGRRPGLLTKILAVAGGAIILAGAVAISIVVFAVALVGVLLFGLYLWWKTRDLRKHLRAQYRKGPVVDENVIEGEVIRKDEPPRTP